MRHRLLIRHRAAGLVKPAAHWVYEIIRGLDTSKQDANAQFLETLPVFDDKTPVKFPWQMKRQGAYWMVWELKATPDFATNTTRVDYTLLVEKAR